MMRTNHYALDTSFIINFLEGDQRALETYKKINSEKLMVPSPVLMESLRGIKNIGRFRHLKVISFGEEESNKVLQIIKYLEEKERMIGLLDVMIAAISSQKNAKIVTYNNDFEKLSGYGLKTMKVDES